MRNEHVIEFLDSKPFESLTADELQHVQDHSRTCFGCRTAYESAATASAVIKRRAQVVLEPSPFFQTKVLAALRERQAAESVPAFVRLWKSAGALASSMAVATVALAALSFIVPTTATPALEQTAYSAESVILDQNSDDQMSYEQVLSTIYADEEEAK